MSTMGFIKRFHNFIRILKKTGDNGMTMRFRLFVFLIALVVLMVSGVVITLLISGPLTGGRGEAEEYVRKDLNRVSDDLATRYGDITVQLCQTGFEIIIFSPDFSFVGYSRPSAVNTRKHRYFGALPP